MTIEDLDEIESKLDVRDIPKLVAEVKRIRRHYSDLIGEMKKMDKEMCKLREDFSAPKIRIPHANEVSENENGS